MTVFKKESKKSSFKRAEMVRLAILYVSWGLCQTLKELFIAAIPRGRF